MTDFLLELRSEEIPARMQKGARADLEKLFAKEMAAAGVQTGEMTVWSTPRRLALIARDLPIQTEAVSEEVKGPPEGAPDQAIDGFCRKNGVTRDQLELRDVKGRQTYFAVIEQPGRAVADVLAEAIPAIIRAFPWPKSMRWGAASISTESLKWVRPLSGIVAIFGDTLVECEVDGVTSGTATMGHRFHHSGEISITGADDYASKLRAAYVIVDHAEREGIVRTGAAKAAADAGLDLVEDQGLVVENAGLTEWPVPLLGRFEDDFLEVPPETIQLTARVNQKYFVCEQDGKLANAFICTANIEAADGGAAIVDGNRKVLAARLSDARFFWDVDRKKTLEEHAKGLERITFHEKLGTVADKVERVATLASWMASEGVIPFNDELIWTGSRQKPINERGTIQDISLFNPLAEDANDAHTAAKFARADIASEMVGEFPELQGIMGGYYAELEGFNSRVCAAISDFYRPVGPRDRSPEGRIANIVALAEKLDTLAKFFAIGEMPTGSKDPFALRRAALGAQRIIIENNIRLKLSEIFYQLLLGPFISEWIRSKGIDSLDYETATWTSQVPGTLASGRIFEVTSLETIDPNVAEAATQRVAQLTAFVVDRLKVQQREAGVRHDLIDAVFALGGEDDLVRLLARVHALQSFMATEDGTNLLAGYKRAANILKKEGVVPAKAGTAIGQGAASAAIPAFAGMTDDSDIVQTGDEDPMENVDAPDMRAVYAAALADKKLSYTPEPAEKALIDALAAAQPKATAAIEAEDFSTAMAALASLRAPIDAFFEEVTVNDSQKNKRAARLDLLAQFRAAVHNVADFSKIEG